MLHSALMHVQTVFFFKLLSESDILEKASKQTQARVCTPTTAAGQVMTCFRRPSLREQF